MGAMVEWVVWWSYFVSLVIYKNVEFWKLYSVGGLQSPAILALSLRLQRFTFFLRLCSYDSERFNYEAVVGNDKDR